MCRLQMEAASGRSSLSLCLFRPGIQSYILQLNCRDYIPLQLPKGYMVLMKTLCRPEKSFESRLLPGLESKELRLQHDITFVPEKINTESSVFFAIMLFSEIIVP